MIYRDSGSKLELYADLYSNSRIGSEEDTTWDPHRPEVDPPQQLPPWYIEKSYGPASASFDHDAHVYSLFATRYEMGTKRTHEGREVKDGSPHADSPNDSAHSGPSSNGSPSAAAQTSQAPPPPLDSYASSAAATTRAPAPSSSELIAKAAYASVTAGGVQAANAAGTADAVPLQPKQAVQAPYPTGPMPSHQLLYHALHHTNILISLLSSYLSQDALTRDFINSARDAHDLPHQHHNTAYSLIAARSRLRECRSALEMSPQVDDYRQKGCFQTWQLATDKLSEIVDAVENGYRIRMLLTSCEIAAIKRTWEDCMLLREGTTQNEGFQLCWDLLLHRR